MKRKRIVLTALALVLLALAGCGVVQKEQEGLRLYYAASLDTHRGGDAIDSVTIDWDELPQGDQVARAESVLALLMGMCQEKGFQSPIPVGTTLRSVTIIGGTACVDFSSSYGQLSGMALTIADYCVALSLTQLDGIYAVRITVNEQELAYRDNDLFLAGDVLLTSMDDVVQTLTARLYFPNSDGVLTAEERLLTQYEGQSAADVVLSALGDGPSDDDLQPLAEKGLSGMTVRMDNGVCQLNVASASMEELEDDTARQLLLCVTQSLQSLEGISSVQLYIDGTYAETYE